MQKSTSYHQHIHLNCGSLHWPLTRGQRGNTNKRKHQKFICGDSGWCIAITGLLPRGCREGTHQVGLFNPRAKWKSLSEVILVGDTRWHWPQGNKSVIAIFDFGSFTKPIATAPWEIIEGKKQVCRTELGPTWGKSVFTMQVHVLHSMHSMQPVKNAGKLKYASFARSSNPFRGRVLFTIHRWTQIVHLVQNWTRPSVTFAKSKVSSSLAKCWEWSQNLSQVCKWHSWEANCKDFLLRAQTYTFILLPRAEQSRLSDPALCLIPAVVDLLPKSANQLGQEIGNQAEIGTFEQEICMYQ